METQTHDTTPVDFVRSEHDIDSKEIPLSEQEISYLPIHAALALVDFGPCKDADRPQDWIYVASAMCAHCEGTEDVNLAAARIITAEYREVVDMLRRCEMWLSTIPAGRNMQLECQRVLSQQNATVG